MESRYDDETHKTSHKTRQQCLASGILKTFRFLLLIRKERCITFQNLHLLVSELNITPQLTEVTYSSEYMESIQGTCHGNRDTEARFSSSNKLIFPANIFIISPYSITLPLRCFKNTTGQHIIIILDLRFDSSHIRAACTYLTVRNAGL